VEVCSGQQTVLQGLQPGLQEPKAQPDQIQLYTLIHFTHFKTLTPCTG
jgi:hypothetical protein